MISLTILCMYMCMHNVSSRLYNFIICLFYIHVYYTTVIVDVVIQSPSVY